MLQPLFFDSRAVDQRSVPALHVSDQETSVMIAPEQAVVAGNRRIDHDDRVGGLAANRGLAVGKGNGRIL